MHQVGFDPNLLTYILLGYISMVPSVNQKGINHETTDQRYPF